MDALGDLDLLRRIYEYFVHDRFSWEEVLTLLTQHPDRSELNRHIPQKEVR